MESRQFTAPNGDMFTLRPITPALLRKVLADLKSKGIKLTGKDDDLLTGIDYQQALSNAILVDWKKNDGNNLRDTSAAERKELIETRPKVVAWATKMAASINADEDKEFEEDSKN